jgi:hypothetical protein
MHELQQEQIHMAGRNTRKYEHRRSLASKKSDELALVGVDEHGPVRTGGD